MKKLALITLATICMLSVYAQLSNPVDSFFIYYCKTYKSFLDKNSGRNFLDDMSKAASYTYNPQYNRIVLQAKEYIKQHYKIKDDKEALMKLGDINSDKFLRTQLVNMTNKQVVLANDSLFQLTGGFVCKCTEFESKGADANEPMERELLALRDCIHKLELSDNVQAIHRRLPNVRQQQLNEVSDNLPIYVFAHCPFLIKELTRYQKATAFTAYDHYMKLQAFDILNTVEKYIQKSDTVTTIERYFVNPEAYKATGDQLNLWRRALQTKYYRHSYIYRYTSESNDFYRFYTSLRSPDMKITIAIKYVFKDGKIASITCLDTEKLQDKDKVIDDLFRGQLIGG